MVSGIEIEKKCLERQLSCNSLDMRKSCMDRRLMGNVWTDRQLTNQ